VGRDFQSGRSAIFAGAEFVSMLEALGASIPGIVVNVGRIDGGGPSNVVPELAIVRFNIRVPDHASQQRVEVELKRIVEQTRHRRDGIRMELSGAFHAPPKRMDAPTRELFDHAITCGRELGLNLTHRPSGGVSDGNRLAAAGLPVIDTLGPRGGNLHSPEEFLTLDSLTERAKLSALLLMKLGSGELSPPRKTE
jgi:glutamate carboxypeptidase